MKKGVLVFLWVIGVIFVLLVAFAILQPFLWELFLGDKTPAPDITITFSSLLTVMIALLALGVGTLGGMTYYVISRRIEEGLKKSAEETYMRTSALTLIHIGFMCWRNYEVEHQLEVKNRHLEHAFEFTHYAYEKYAVNLVEENRDNKKLICIVKNNLAYYLAECCQPNIYKDINWGYLSDRCKLSKNRATNCKLALDYAEYVYKRTNQFPDRIEKWLHTYYFVQELYNNCTMNNKMGVKN